MNSNNLVCRSTATQLLRAVLQSLSASPGYTHISAYFFTYTTYSTCFTPLCQSLYAITFFTLQTHHSPLIPISSWFGGRHTRCWRPSYVLCDGRRTRCWRPSHNEHCPEINSTLNHNNIRKLVLFICHIGYKIIHLHNNNPLKQVLSYSPISDTAAKPFHARLT